MDGSYPQAIYWEPIELLDMSREAEFNSWYDRVRIPACTSNTLFSHANRFVNRQAKSGEAYSVAIYEMHGEAALSDSRSLIESPGNYALSSHMFESIRPLASNIYKRIGGEYRARYKRPVRGMLCVISNCAPEREAEFNAWYEDIHLGDILETGLFHTAYRYECIDVSRQGDTGGGKYLAIYETELDPAKAVEAIAPFLAKLGEAGRLSNTIQVVDRFVGQRVWPAD